MPARVTSAAEQVYVVRAVTRDENKFASAITTDVRRNYGNPPRCKQRGGCRGIAEAEMVVRIGKGSEDAGPADDARLQPRRSRPFRQHEVYEKLDRWSRISRRRLCFM
jgi:hypothetical protein